MKSLMRLTAVMVRTGLSKTTIYELMGEGDFPKPVSLSRRSVAWVEDEVHSWIQARIQKSRGIDVGARSKKPASFSSRPKAGRVGA